MTQQGEEIPGSPYMAPPVEKVRHSSLRPCVSQDQLLEGTDLLSPRHLYIQDTAG